MKQTLTVALFGILISPAYADQGSFTNSGGSTGVSSGVSITSNVASPAGTLTLNCPTTSTGRCAGGSFTYLSNDGTNTISASFTSGTYAESCSGGGRGGHITCSYTFTGYISGTWTLNGVAQAIIGVTYQAFGTGGASANGTTAYNSAYIPFYYSDSEQILRSDDLQGTNQISFGSGGSGVGQFYGAYGIALDLAGRIYVADTYNCRIVRIDDMNGTNWTSYGGTCASGQGQFYDPSGIAVDSTGKIYVMDTGNSRFIRIDDMNGTNWVSYGAVGSGVGQFASFTSVTVDASDRIYVADTGNRRVVRIDDMNGTNWTTLTQSPPINGVTYSFASPVAVAVDSAGKIYVADNGYYAPAVIRVDDMTGANWTSIYTSPSGSTGLNSVSVDASGTVFTGGGGVRLVDNMAGVLTSSGTIGPVGSYYVFGVTSVPLPSPRPSAISLLPGTLSFAQKIGTTSPSQPVIISNFGGSPLDIMNISANGEFAETNNCPNVLVAGSNCTVSVTFAPSVPGPADGLLTVADDSGNLGAAQTVILTGMGLTDTPTPTLTPTPTSDSGTPAATDTATVTPTVIPTPTATQDDSGFIPPDPNTARCEETVSSHLAKFAVCTTRCEVKQADFALAGKFFDEEACEAGTGTPVSCRAAYDRATTSLVAQGICPACLDAAAQGSLADLMTTVLEDNSGLIYCAGTSGFGGDDTGFVPPDANTAKCEDTASRNISRLATCVMKCQTKQAKFALAGRFFDEEACETGTGTPLSCRAAYDKATTSLVAQGICPACLNATVQGDLADLMTAFLETNNRLIYCAGTVPVPLP